MSEYIFVIAMRWILGFTLLLAASSLITQCTIYRSPKVNTVSSSSPVQIVEEAARSIKDTVFVLSPGLSFKIDSAHSILFYGIKSDSRCPKDVHCLWQGEGSIYLRFKNKQMDTIFPLSTIEDPHHHNVIRINSFDFTLQDLRPYPVGKIPIQNSDYKVVIKVHFN